MAAVKNPARPALQIRRDEDLKPGEILAFAGIKPGQAVAELLPEGGYYTRLLSGAVGAKGRVYAMVPRPGGDEGMQMASDGPKAKDPSLNAPLTRVQRAFVMESEPTFKNVGVYWEALVAECDFCASKEDKPTIGAFSLPEQLDAVVAANAYHVFKGELAQYTVRGKTSSFNMGELDKAIYRAMKNGGVFLVTDNTAAKGTGFAGAATLNRVDPDAVKAEVTAAGFVFDGESTALRKNNDDRSKRAEDVLMTRTAAAPDMFVFRFKKPANAANGTYQEFGRWDSGNNVFATGTWFWDADGRMCRHHLYQDDARDMADCNGGVERLGHKVGDKWLEDDGKTPVEIMKGYVYFDE
jgi:predicted methyltransferase